MTPAGANIASLVGVEFRASRQRCPQRYAFPNTAFHTEVDARQRLGAKAHDSSVTMVTRFPPTAESFSNNRPRTAALATGNWIARAQSSAGANERIGIGIIGSGDRASAHTQEIFANAAKQNVRIVAVCDVWKRNREATAARVKKSLGQSRNSSRVSRTSGVARSRCRDHRYTGFQSRADSFGRAGRGQRRLCGKSRVHRHLLGQPGA